VSGNRRSGSITAMMLMALVVRVTAILLFVGGTKATSCSPGRQFPKPSYPGLSLKETFSQISSTLSNYFADPKFNATNVAIEVTSSQETLWGFYQAAKDRSSQDGASVIGPDTVFRVTRVSKILTAIAVLQLHEQGRIASLHDEIKAYIPDLEPSRVEWGRITIWDLLTNMAGIVDMCLLDLSLQIRCKC
jgi:CubicO group peptidase (beta-lactamase class C family)